MLSVHELQTYRDDGLVIPKDYRVPAQLLERLRDAVEAVIASNPDTPQDQLFNLHLDRAPPFLNRGDSAFTDLVHNRALLDMVEQIIGLDIILWATQLFCKQAIVGREVPWHQDSRYWAVRPLQTCTAWVAFDESNRTNGALKFIPGSHMRGLYSHRTDDSPDLALHQVLDDERFDESQAQIVELVPGQVSLHHADLVHGSAPNVSGQRRAGLSIRYMPATSAIDRSLDMSAVSRLDWAVLPLVLVRGENQNRANKNHLSTRS
jgi:hypothetical protein